MKTTYADSNGPIGGDGLEHPKGARPRSRSDRLKSVGYLSEHKGDYELLRSVTRGADRTPKSIFGETTTRCVQGKGACVRGE